MVIRTSPDELTRILGRWGASYRRTRDDLDLTGSPERTEFRTAVEDDGGNVFVLERIPEAKCEHRRRISTVLFRLAERGVPAIHPYIRNLREGTVTEYDGTYWQLMPFVEGVALPRPGYVSEEWRGRALGEFLVALRRASDPLPSVPADVFSITRYLLDLVARFRRKLPGLADELQPFLTHLQKGFVDAHDALPTAFCHGDYHPLNIIWGARCLNSVLDWEFMGYKPEVYDLANMVGCVGMDRPEALLRGLAPSLLNAVRDAGIIEPASWTWFLDYVLALRFAWMREWVLRNNDEMINLELAFMFLLIDNREAISGALQLAD